MQQVEFILYVSDQNQSTAFYTKLLGKEPELYVPGMTEFQLGPNVKLGLMPEEGIARIIHPPLPHPKTGKGIPRCELYLKVGNAERYMERGVRLGAKEVSALIDRDWGDRAGYLADPDGHVLAFAMDIPS